MTQAMYICTQQWVPNILPPIEYYSQMRNSPNLPELLEECRLVISGVENSFPLSATSLQQEANINSPSLTHQLPP